MFFFCFFLFYFFHIGLRKIAIVVAIIVNNYIDFSLWDRIIVYYS